MTTYLEHANVTVPNIDAAIEFLKTVDPDFVIRKDSHNPGANNYRWAHVGNDNFYIALQERHKDSGANQTIRPYQDVGINHLGWVVEDFDAVTKRLNAKGYEIYGNSNDHPSRKRTYYYDSAGFEWEIIEYLSDDPAERNYYVEEKERL